MCAVRGGQNYRNGPGLARELIPRVIEWLRSIRANCYLCEILARKLALTRVTFVDTRAVEDAHTSYLPFYTLARQDVPVWGFLP